MSHESPRLLVLGAHPDDAEFFAGGLISCYRQMGRDVRIISVTNGAAGHHRLQPTELAKVRRRETLAVVDLIGCEYDVWDFPDGQLQPTLEVRTRIIREIRSYQPDMVLTHRPCDYHPDHRAVGVAVQDASYMVTVPLSVPDVPAMRRDPIVAYMNDLFTRPVPLHADATLDIGPWVDNVVAMLSCHRSQVFEWLPYNQRLDHVESASAEHQRQWLRDWYTQRARTIAARFRPALERDYGAAAGSIEFAEVFEISEYAAPADAKTLGLLFPRHVRS